MLKSLRVIHIIDRFNPLLGQEINVFAQNKSENIDFHIITSKSLTAAYISCISL